MPRILARRALLMDMLPIIDEFELAMLAIDGTEESRCKGHRDALLKLHRHA